MVNSPAAPSIEFPGRSSGEAVQFYFRQHWIRLVRPVVRMFIWLILLTIAFTFMTGINAQGQETTRHVMLFLLTLFLLFSQFEFLNAFYRHFLHILIVTDRKIHRIKKTLFVVDEHHSIDVSALQDVRKAQRGPIQNILGFGSLTLEAQESVLRIHFVPAIQRKYNAILTLRGWEQSRTAQVPLPHAAPPTVIIDDE